MTYQIVCLIMRRDKKVVVSCVLLRRFSGKTVLYDKTGEQHYDIVSALSNLFVVVIQAVYCSP
jgi:replication-associated recombination protein RarA